MKYTKDQIKKAIEQLIKDIVPSQGMSRGGYSVYSQNWGSKGLGGQELVREKRRMQRAQRGHAGVRRPIKSWNARRLSRQQMRLFGVEQETVGKAQEAFMTLVKAIKKQPKGFDLIDHINRHESGQLDEEGTNKLFQHLVDTGMINHLQGHYGRTAKDLLDAGRINLKKSDDEQYCDHCGDPLKGKNFVPVPTLPVNIDSANAGESAVVCPDCHKKHIAPHMKKATYTDPFSGREFDIDNEGVDEENETYTDPFSGREEKIDPSQVTPSKKKPAKTPLKRSVEDEDARIRMNPIDRQREKYGYAPGADDEIHDEPKEEPKPEVKKPNRFIGHLKGAEKLISRIKKDEGEKVRVPHKGQMVEGKVVRNDKEAPGHPATAVVDVGEAASIKVPHHKVETVKKAEEKKPKVKQLKDMTPEEAAQHKAKWAKWHEENPNYTIRDLPMPSKKPTTAKKADPTSALILSEAGAEILDKLYKAFGLNPTFVKRPNTAKAPNIARQAGKPRITAGASIVRKFSAGGPPLPKVKAPAAAIKPASPKPPKAKIAAPKAIK